MPGKLAGEYTNNPLNMFKLWLDAKGDWSKVEATVARGNSRESRSLLGSDGTKARDMKYPEAKKKIVMDVCTKNGWYVEDRRAQRFTSPRAPD